jgi:hypothetical protein
LGGSATPSRRAQPRQALRCLGQTRLEIADAEARQGALHAVDEAGAFADQRFALAARPPGVFRLERRDRRHRAVIAFARSQPRKARFSSSTSSRSVFARRCSRETATLEAWMT